VKACVDLSFLLKTRTPVESSVHQSGAPNAQALKEGRLRAQALQPDERMRRPGLSTLVLDEADLMLSMPGYEEDLQAVAPLVNT
jgi:hypothetical protein